MAIVIMYDLDDLVLDMFSFCLCNGNGILWRVSSSSSVFSHYKPLKIITLILGSASIHIIFPSSVRTLLKGFVWNSELEHKGVFWKTKFVVSVLTLYQLKFLLVVISCDFILW